MTSERPLSLSVPENIIPEDHLLKDLSPTWQRRFDQALKLIIHNIANPMQWDDIAEQCAITPNHFHQMFRSLIGETPGQYRKRMGLKHAVYYLYYYPAYSITDVALASGFSSSQALAKALRRELDITASDIKNKDEHDPSWQKIETALAHSDPNHGHAMEDALAKNIVFEIISLEDNNYRELSKIQERIITPEQYWLERAPSACTELAYIHWGGEGNTSTNSQPNSEYTLAYACPKQDATFQFPDKNYLHCRVLIGSESGYFSTWKALYKEIIKKELEPDPSTPSLELLHNIRNNDRHMDMSFYIPLG